MLSKFFDLKAMQYVQAESKMYLDYSYHCKSEFYYLDYVKFVKNNPILLSTSYIDQANLLIIKKNNLFTV